MRGELGKKMASNFSYLYIRISLTNTLFLLLYSYIIVALCYIYIYIYISYIIIWRYNCRNNLKSVNTGETRPVAFEDFHWKQKVGFFLDLAQVRSKEP